MKCVKVGNKIVRVSDEEARKITEPWQFFKFGEFETRQDGIYVSKEAWRKKGRRYLGKALSPLTGKNVW